MYISEHESNVTHELMKSKNEHNCCEGKQKIARPLYAAAFCGHDDTVKLLLKSGADVDFCDDKGNSPLFVACGNGHYSTAKSLLNHGADVNLCNKEGVSPLTKAAQCGYNKIVELLLLNGGNVDL